MISIDKRYRISKFGRRAATSDGVPAWHRAILYSLEAEMSCEDIVAGMAGHSRSDVLAWIEQLEALGFIVEVTEAPSQLDAQLQDPPCSSHLPRPA